MESPLEHYGKNKAGELIRDRLSYLKICHLPVGEGVPRDPAFFWLLWKMVKIDMQYWFNSSRVPDILVGTSKNDPTASRLYFSLLVT